IEIETGMNRLGVKEEEWKRFAQLAQESPGLSVEGIFTHFAESDSIDPGFTQLQLAQFQKAVQQFEKTFQKRLIRHTANSGALLSFPESFFDWVRPGIALYGYPPLSPSTLSKTLHPILEWRALLVQVKNIASGESVGYNRAFRASSPMKIGT